MKNLYKLLVLVSWLIFCLMNTKTYANEEGNKINGAIALGIISLPEYEGSADKQLLPLLSSKLVYKHYELQLEGTSLKLDLSESSQFLFGPSLNLRLKRGGSIENKTILTLQEIDNALELGGFITMKSKGVFSQFDSLNFNIEILADLSSVHSGILGNFELEYAYPLTRQLIIRTSLASIIASDRFINTYFGVDERDSISSGLRQFEGEASIKDISLKLSTNYALNQHWGVMAFLSYQVLVGDAADSPIVNDVGETRQIQVGAAMSYSF